MSRIVEYLNKTVWATLRPSKIHGVGVFAIRDIKAGTLITDYSIHTLNNVGFLKLPVEDFKKLEPAIQNIILDRNMFRKDQENLYFYSPNMECCLTSFMNHNDDANSDGQFALRDIKEGEEITEDYKKLEGGHELIINHYPWLKLK